MVYSFRVPGDPIGQPRHRVGRGRAYLRDDEPIHAWKQVVRFLGRRHCPEPIEGPVALLLAFAMPRPLGHYRTKGKKRTSEIKSSAPLFCDQKPDFDNLEKAIADGLSGIAFKDDRQVVFSQTMKLYVESGEDSSVEILVAGVEPGLVDSMRCFVRSILKDESIR